VWIKVTDHVYGNIGVYREIPEDFPPLEIPDVLNNRKELRKLITQLKEWAKEETDIRPGGVKYEIETGEEDGRYRINVGEFVLDDNVLRAHNKSRFIEYAKVPKEDVFAPLEKRAKELERKGYMALILEETCDGFDVENGKVGGVLKVIEQYRRYCSPALLYLGEEESGVRCVNNPYETCKNRLSVGPVPDEEVTEDVLPIVEGAKADGELPENLQLEDTEVWKIEWTEHIDEGISETFTTYVVFYKAG